MSEHLYIFLYCFFIFLEFLNLSFYPFIFVLEFADLAIHIVVNFL